MIIAYNPIHFKVVRVMRSTTQGSAQVWYGDLLLETYGDNFGINEKGQWVSTIADEVFLNGGKEILAKKFEEMAAQVRASRKQGTAP